MGVQKEKKKTCISIVKVLSFLVVCISLVFLGFPANKGNFNSSLLDKVERLKSIEGPRVVLVGNSNLPFGVDSSLLEQQLGVPVVNLGINGLLGHEFNERMALIDVHEGDLYVLCHTEYSQSQDEKDYQYIWLAIEEDLSHIDLVGQDNLYSLFKVLPEYLRKGFFQFGKEKHFRFPYSRDSLNCFGDVLEHNDQNYDFTEEDISYLPDPIDGATASRINELDFELKKRGANLVICAFPIGEGTASASPEFLNSWRQDMQTKITPSIISDFRDYVFDRSLFYDTRYHMTSEGAKLRTIQLAEDIELFWSQNES